MRGLIYFFFFFLSEARPIYERFPDIYVLWWLNFISNPHFLLGMKLDMKKEGWPSQKSFKLISKLHPRHSPMQPRRAHRYATKKPQKLFQHWCICPRHTIDTNEPQRLLQPWHMCPWGAAVPSSDLRQPGVHYRFTHFIMHISDYDRLNYRKTCWIEPVVQSFATVN